MALKTLIADDEPLAREWLRFLLAGNPDFVIAGECRNGREVAAALQQERYDVLFLDIEMPGGTGFETIEQVGAMQMPVTIFVTAHVHYAARAFDVHALDYLTKPVETARFQATLLRIREMLASQAALRTHEQLQSALLAFQQGVGRREYPSRLVVPSGARDTFVHVDDIEWIEAADYYACLHVGARSYMLRETIKQLAENLDPERFIRVHRSTIVNITQVREVIREGRHEGWVSLANGRRLKMSHTGWQKLVAASRR